MASLALRISVRNRLIADSRYTCLQCRNYAISSPSDLTPPPPPLLSKLRKDLKTAMVEKDTNRLSVLRSLIADVTNSAKANRPIKSDMELVSMMRKRQAAAKQASDEFKAAGRNDLVEKEEGQVNVLEEYAGSVETMSENDVRDVVIRAVEEVKTQADGKINTGDVLKRLLAPGGSLDGQSVDKKEVARIVKDVLTMS